MKKFSLLFVLGLWALSFQGSPLSAQDEGVFDGVGPASETQAAQPTGQGSFWSDEQSKELRYNLYQQRKRRKWIRPVQKRAYYGFKYFREGEALGKGSVDPNAPLRTPRARQSSGRRRSGSGYDRSYRGYPEGSH